MTVLHKEKGQNLEESHSALIFGCRALKVRKYYSLNYITPLI